MKRFFSLILTVAMLFSINTVAYASEVASGDEFVEATPIYVDVETRLMETFTSPAGALPATTTDIEASNNMEDKIVASANEDLTRAATWTYLSNYLVYNQTTSYNCGPASVQAALKYINGNTPTQAKIAEGCKTTTSGTYLSNMLTYINGQQSANKYVSKYNANSDTMKSCLYSGVVTYNAAPVIGMAFSSNDGWLYSSGGHFMSVYGATSDKSKFALADPWIGYSGSGLSNNSWSYSKSATDIYDAYSSVNIGLMY